MEVPFAKLRTQSDTATEAAQGSADSGAEDAKGEAQGCAE